jgi:hypothetical protein
MTVLNDQSDRPFSSFAAFQLGSSVETGSGCHDAAHFKSIVEQFY